MIAVVLTPAAADILCARISAALGYPIRCTDIHGAPLDLWTESYVEPLPHPTDPARVAVPIDEAIREIEHPEVIAACAAAVTLGAEWAPRRHFADPCLSSPTR